MRHALCVALTFLAASVVAADEPKKSEKKAEKKASLPTGTLSSKDWLAASTKPLEPGEIDQLINAELDKAKIKPASRTTDEQFLRRVYLDVTGKLPTPKDIVDFLKSNEPNKRAKVIDQLLDSDDYAKHWGLYWRDVIASRVTDNFARIFVRQFDPWIRKQIKE